MKKGKPLFDSVKIKEILNKARAATAERQAKKVFPFDSGVETPLYISAGTTKLFKRDWDTFGQTVKEELITPDKILKRAKKNAYKVVLSNNKSIEVCEDTVLYVSGLDFHRVKDISLKSWNLIINDNGKLSLEYVKSVENIGVRDFIVVKTDGVSIFLCECGPLAFNSNSSEFIKKSEKLKSKNKK